MEVAIQCYLILIKYEFLVNFVNFEFGCKLNAALFAGLSLLRFCILLLLLDIRSELGC